MELYNSCDNFKLGSESANQLTKYTIQCIQTHNLDLAGAGAGGVARAGAGGVASAGGIAHAGAGGAADNK